MSVVDINETAIEPEQRRLPWRAIGIGAAALVAVLIIVGLFGELGPFLAQGLNVLPFVGLAVLAALGERRDWARWLTYLYVALLNGGLLLVSLAMVMMTGFGANLPTPDSADPAQVLAMMRPAFLFLGIGLVLYAISLLALTPPARRAAARIIPLRPESTMNAAGLSVALALMTMPLAALIVLNGQPPLLALMNLPGAGEMSVRALDQIYFLAWLLPASLVLVGWPIVRRFQPSLPRLGVERPSLMQIGIGIGVGVALVVAISLLEPVFGQIWRTLGLPQTDTQAFSKLMAGLITPIGAVVIAITAGLGEELAVRGVLQPRLGILLANLTFTAAHAFQYSWDGLLVVFLVGLALGVLRARTNTMTSAIAHGVYNFILVMMAVMAGSSS